MITGWRLYVGRRNFSASARRGSGFAAPAANAFVLLLAGTTERFLGEFAIMLPRKPSARQRGTDAGCACRELPQLLPRAKREAKPRAKFRQRCVLRGHRLRWRAWRPRV